MDWSKNAHEIHRRIEEEYEMWSAYQLMSEDERDFLRRHLKISGVSISTFDNEIPPAR